MKRIVSVLSIILIIVTCTSCAQKEEEKKELLFYIGITMVKPVSELVENFEKEHNCEITIIQGGSQDLYDSLKKSEKGDLYMPGSYSYRNNNLDDGLLLDAVLVGYNKAAIMVKEDNPLGFTKDLEQLANEDYKVVICNAESGSIGRETKKILDTFGNYEAVFDNSIFITTDSRNLTDAIVENKADLCINWYATTVWEENAEQVDAIIIDEEFATKKMLILNLTSCSNEPELTKEFMAYASSDEGKEVFKRCGFIDEEDLKVMDGVEFE